MPLNDVSPVQLILDHSLASDWRNTVTAQQMTMPTTTTARRGSTGLDGATECLESPSGAPVVALETRNFQNQPPLSKSGTLSRIDFQKSSSASGTLVALQ